MSEFIGVIFACAIIAIAILWVVAGVAAFIMSLVCFGYNGSVFDKIIGLLLAILFGPFYWIFYNYNKNYCH
jgi:hypothetical protein